MQYFAAVKIFNYYFCGENNTLKIALIDACIFYFTVLKNIYTEEKILLFSLRSELKITDKTFS